MAGPDGPEHSASPVDASIDAPTEAPSHAPARRSRLRWWKEVLYIAAFYGVYTFIRNTQGSASVSEATAMANALEIIRAEEALNIYVEEAVQEAFLGWPWFIELWNVFYGTFHFVVTIVALVLLFRRFPDRYPRWRNTLAFTTALALVGFATYPLLPPRLLPASFGYVDTLRAYGSLWSFESGAVNKLSNQYAAMPSLHFAWAVWSSLVLVLILRRPWAKALAVVYPAATLFAIVVTGNHFILDAVGGAACLGVGALAGFALAARIGVDPAREPVSNPH
ncbi:MAG: phosphatase PAP2 family protein [Actinomycetota bacterium]|nr:phosphatase PAP2 family protein [Actinomycetota bacterium]